MPEEAKRFLFNESWSLCLGGDFPKVKDPEFACSDADIYERMLDENWEIKRKIIFECDGYFYNEKNPSAEETNKDTFERQRADEYQSFREDKQRICRIAREMLTAEDRSSECNVTPKPDPTRPMPGPF